MLIYLDNNVFRTLSTDLSNNAWNQFYDECKINEPQLIEEGFESVCAWFTILEFIGLGRALKAIKSEIDKRCLKIQEEIQNHLLTGAEIDPPHEIIDRIGREIIAVFNSSSGFTAENLLYKIYEQLQFSKSAATKELLDGTLLRYKKQIENEEFQNQLLFELLIDRLGAFNFVFPEQIPEKKCQSVLERFKPFSETLFAVVHDKFTQGIYTPFFRLAEKSYMTEMFLRKKMGEFDNNPVQKQWMEEYLSSNAMLDAKHDLGDVAFIDHAVLGLVQNNNGILTQTTIVSFTGDNPNVVKRRTGLFHSTLISLSQQVEGWQLKPFQGPIYCIDPNFKGIKFSTRIVEATV